MAESQRPNLFFAVGSPKSGTTFLQRMLNMHPQVSCPSEQQVEMLRFGLGELLDNYQLVVNKVDESTGGQGAPRIRLGTRSRIFRDVVLRLSIDFAGDKPIHGLNENLAVFKDLPRFNEQFKQPLIVLLFRNPIDLATSVWRHNHRMARAEPENAKHHLSLLQNPRGSLEGFVEYIVDVYARRVASIIDYIDGRDNILTVRYEVLVQEKVRELARIFEFLGADTGEAVIADIVAASSKEAMAKASKTPAFFGVGAHAEPPVKLAEDFRREMLDRWLTPKVEAIGYTREEG